jgi:hypothetical protein
MMIQKIGPRRKAMKNKELPNRIDSGATTRAQCVMRASHSECCISATLVEPTAS